MAKPTAQVIAQVRTMARTFQAVIDLADALGEVQSVEQATAEANAKLVSIRKECDEAVAQWRTARDAKVAADNETAFLVAEAHARAKQIVADAEHAARVAREGASRIQTDAAAEIAAMRQAADSLLADTVAKADAAARELTEVETKIENARKRIAKMLGD